MVWLVLVVDSSNVVYLVVLVSLVISWLVSDDSSNVLVVVDSFSVYVMYVSMCEGRANYQYYALRGSE